MPLIRALFLLLLTVPAYAGDQEVQFDGINGKLHTPESGDNGRAVLLLHGFNGHMDEVGNLYADLAAELGRRGIASLRINFTGEGERSGYVVTSTLDSRIEESEKAYAYMADQFPDARYGVQGFSLGGLTAMVVAAKHPTWFQSMVLWSAADSMNKPGDLGYSRAVQKAVREGKAVVKDWTEMTLTRDHVTSFLGVDASLTISQYPGAFFAIRGDKDFLPANERKWFDLLPTNDKSSLLIGGADHIFNVLENPRPNYGDQVIKATANRFEATLN